MSERLVFDSEALLAFYLGEEGGEVVRDSLGRIQSGEAEGYLNIINLTEICYILRRVDPELAEEKERNLRLYGLKIIPIDDNTIWREAAEVKSEHALSIADAFAAATAKVLKSKLVVGSDSEFKKLDLELLKIRRQR